MEAVVAVVAGAAVVVVAEEEEEEAEADEACEPGVRRWAYLASRVLGGGTYGRGAPLIAELKPNGEGAAVEDGAAGNALPSVALTGAKRLHT